MQKLADPADISVLFFSAGANFWAILGHFWVISGPFWVIFGHFLGHCVAFLDKFAEISNFFCGPVGVLGLAFRMYDKIICSFHLFRHHLTTFTFIQLLH